MNLQEIYETHCADTSAPDATVSFVVRRGYGFELDGQLINGVWTIEPGDFDTAARNAERAFGC